MPLYTVFAPPPRPGEAAADPLSFVFVKDGYCWPALFIPELWLLVRRMWLVFVLYLAASLIVGVIGTKVGGALPWVALILMHLLFALEANALRRWKLASAGYELLGVTEGRRDEAELRFFNQWQPPAPAMAPVASAPPTPVETIAEPSPGAAATGAAPWTPAADRAKPEEMPAEPAKVAAESGGVVGLFPTPGGTA